MRKLLSHHLKRLFEAGVDAPDGDALIDGASHQVGLVQSRDSCHVTLMGKNFCPDFGPVETEPAVITTGDDTHVG